MIIHGDVWAKCTGDSHIMPLSCARQDCQGGYSGPPCRWPGDPAGTRQAVDLQRTSRHLSNRTARLAAGAVLITPAAEEVRTKTGRCLGEEGCGR